MQDKKDDKKGRDVPTGDGTISDEDMDAITGKNKENKPTGQDHSTEHHEDQMPRDGVGAIQDSSLIKEDIAHIEEDE